ncbi:MAG TPA: enoyl-CoA hydratase/isomerase family protein [Quisquiliibacterium sp.]|nr:enoyl-CoA hydratase/isomerase family protein [Quisquiliibacterium sp.]
MSSELPVLFEERDAGGGRRVGFATLNRARQLNALNLEMCQLMLERFRTWASDESIAAVVLDGAGDKGFSAGGDVAEVIRQVRAGGPQRFVYGDAFFEVEYQLDLLIHAYPKPFVSYSHGVCMGGGVGLTVGASHRVVADGSRIAMPEIHIGLFPDVGGGWFLNRVGGGAGTVMALTGLTINEADALFAGLSDYFVPVEARADLYGKLLALPWTGEAGADRAALSRLLLSEHRRFKAGLPVSRLQMYFDAIRFIAMQPDVTAVRDALLAAAAEDEWFKAPAQSLANGSPTAAHVTWEYLRRARRMSLAEVLAMDLTLARQCQRHADFPEGVRALLIDKDRSPKWSPASFGEVSRALVAEHFSWED